MGFGTFSAGRTNSDDVSARAWMDKAGWAREAGAPAILSKCPVNGEMAVGENVRLGQPGQSWWEETGGVRRGERVKEGSH